MMWFSVLILVNTTEVSRVQAYTEDVQVNVHSFGCARWWIYRVLYKADVDSMVDHVGCEPWYLGNAESGLIVLKRQKLLVPEC